MTPKRVSNQSKVLNNIIQQVIPYLNASYVLEFEALDNEKRLVQLMTSHHEGS